MNIFVTVGTTGFLELIKSVDLQIGKIKMYNIEAQIGNSNYIPQNIEYYNYTDKLSERIDHADIVIAHGGAGTIYHLLEIQKKTIIVPNPKVRVNHQIEIAKFAVQNNYAVAVYDLKNLFTALQECEKKTFDKYVNDNDLLIKHLDGLINS